MFLLFVSCTHLSHLTECLSTQLYFDHFQQQRNINLFLQQYNPVFYDPREIIRYSL